MFSKDIFTPLFETPAHKQLAILLIHTIYKLPDMIYQLETYNEDASRYR